MAVAISLFYYYIIVVLALNTIIRCRWRAHTRSCAYTHIHKNTRGVRHFIAMKFRFYCILNVTIAHKIHLQQLNIWTCETARKITFRTTNNKNMREISIFHDYICIDVNFIWGREKKKMFVCVKLICALSEKYVALCNYACSSIIMFAEDANGWNCIVPLKLNVK